MGGRTIHTAAELHQQAVAETERGRHAVGRRLLLRALRAGPDPELRVHILISLAYHTAERRGLADGLDLLRQADEAPELPRRLRGLVASQRALLLMRAGAATEAVTHFDTALRLLQETQPEDVGRALLNRGYIAMQQRRYAPARSDFASCVELARRHGFTLLGAKASHNLGYLWSLFGDLPRALREMDAVAPVLTSQSPTHVATYHVDRAQVLLAAGLFREADEDLARAAELFRAAGVRQDQAEAELTRAQVALSEHRWSDARQLAVLARRRFTGRGATGWALLAAYIAVAARVGQRVRPQAAAVEAEALAQRLDQAGLHDDARRARLTAAQAALTRSGDVSRAEALAGDALRLRRHDPLATRLHARTVRAQLAEATGASARASRERRAGLVELHRYQASFGSMDLRTAASAHGRQLATDGLARALADNQPASVFQWAEQTRALSARLPPVLPPADEQAAQMLEELRDARMELRKQSIAGQVDPQLRARCHRLEQRIRQRSWYTPGQQGDAVAPAPLSTLRAELAASGSTFVAHLICDQRLYALVVTGNQQRLQPLGPAGEVVETHLRLRRDLDALALSHLPEPVRASVRSASRTALGRLDEWLWKPLRGRLGDGPLLLAPAAELTAVPWTLLPALRGRPVTVTASVTAWLRRRRQGQQLPADPAAALAAGPGVLRALDEIRLVAKVWSVPEPDRESSTEQVRRAAGSADVLHVAAHGTHEPENPLFSYLDLVDGPLFGHELKQLSRLPAHVVLSACELGRAGTRPGGETLGMTAALLHGGAGSVVAGVARITDLVAYQIGPAHHAGLRQGLSPAAALANAIDGLDPDADPAPLVCFGAGW